MDHVTRVPSLVLSRIGTFVQPLSYFFYGEPSPAQTPISTPTSIIDERQNQSGPSNDPINNEEGNPLWRVEKVIEEWKESESKGLSVCIVGRVSTGKSSLVSALFAPDPREPVPDHPLNGKIKVGAEGGTTQKPCTILADLGTGGKLLIIDLPGLHDTVDAKPPAPQNFSRSFFSSQRVQSPQPTILPNVSSLFKILKKNVIDLGIFVIDGVPTDTSVEDFKRLQEISKKVFLVFNKVDTLAYLKPEKKNEIIELTRTKMGANEIFPTVCKGFDPEADRSNPNWYEVTGVAELQDAILNFVRDYKDKELTERMKNKEFWKNFQNITIRTAISVGVLAMVLVRASK